MPTLAEILAKRKAEAAAPITKVQDLETRVAAQEITPAQATSMLPPSDILKEEVKTIEAPVKEEPANSATPKKLSFAEMMALKKKPVSSESQSTKTSVSSASQATDVPSKDTNSATASSNSQPNSTSVSDSPKAAAPAVVAKPLAEAPAPTPVLVDTTAPEGSPSIEVQQAYADIKGRLDTLNELAGTDLQSAMQELKKSLMANPAAVSLMEDLDIAQMVIGLRKLTGEDIADAAKDKPKGRKPATKMVDLTDPSAVASIFEEL